MKLPGQVGMTLSGDFAMPLGSQSEEQFSGEDSAAALRWNTFHINWILDPLLSGNWPEMMTDQVPIARLPRFSLQEQNLLKNSIDFVGIMHKTYQVVSLREQQSDIEADSYSHDVNVTVQFDWKARQDRKIYFAADIFHPILSIFGFYRI